ncbi:hypothetical protein LOK49_LG07G03212 [Camellia lanceoleosa]|uniref:Uncharacterized protein n=1 Tax=Camellia lanceoleosa TaxID=1840588 RepID=A0ACC0GYL3_9ERIC|nr:hypothetical protein LOK49_LG07G03212 [Camellia lanceoleosa]
MRKIGKVPKFLSHRLFRSSRYSIWLDSKMQLHYTCHCVWEEMGVDMKPIYGTTVVRKRDKAERKARLVKETYNPSTLSP